MDGKIQKILQLQQEGFTRQEISKKVGYKRLDSMTRYLKKHNFILKNDKYVIDVTTEVPANTIVVNSNTHPNTTTNTRTTTETTTMELIVDSIPTTQATTNTLDDQIRNVLQDDIHVLQEMINKYKKNMEVYNNSITIDLIDDKHLKQYPKSIRVNEFIWEDWTKFCEEHNIFSKKDLISMALKKYMENHNE